MLVIQQIRKAVEAIEVVDNLTTTEPGKALDAAQGFRLNDDKMSHLGNSNPMEVDMPLILQLFQIGFDLSYIHFTNIVINDLLLAGGQVRVANFSNCTLISCCFGENVGCCNFYHSQIIDSRFLNTNLITGSFYYATITNCTFDHTNLKSAKFNYCTFSNVSFDWSCVANANFLYSTGLDPDINIQLAMVNKDPFDDLYSEVRTPWSVIWTNGLEYICVDNVFILRPNY